MVDYDRIQSFLSSLLPNEKDEALAKLYRDAREREIPVIRPETGNLIQTLLKAKQPARALEIGTAIGYSAIITLRAMGERGRLTGMELDKARAEEARKNLEAFGYKDQSEVLIGDAAQLLKTLPENTYDYIFLDAAKGQYLVYLKEILRVARPGAVLLSDNILQNFTVMDSRFMVERRDRTIHARIREYLDYLMHTEGIATSVLPVGDGVAYSVIWGTAFTEVEGA